MASAPVPHDDVGHGDGGRRRRAAAGDRGRHSTRPWVAPAGAGTCVAEIGQVCAGSAPGDAGEPEGEPVGVADGPAAAPPSLVPPQPAKHEGERPGRQKRLHGWSFAEGAGWAGVAGSSATRSAGPSSCPASSRCRCATPRRLNARRGRRRSSTAASSAPGSSVRPASPAPWPRAPDPQPHGLPERQVAAVLGAQQGGDRLALPADDDRAVLLGHRAVVGQPVELVLRGGAPDLGDDELHLVRLAGLGEDRAERLGVGVGQPAAGHVAAVVLVAAQVGVAHAGQAQVLELVVLADRGERDPVVDLADLVQRARRVLTQEQDAVGVGQHQHRAAARDALARVVAAVLHELLGR